VRGLRRVVLAFVASVAVGLIVTLAGVPPASAHALAVSSNPPTGATLAEAPKTVTIGFSETPDPNLSTIEVLDSAGNPHQIGHSQPAPGQPETLEVAVGPLDPGVYTVNWRTVSKVDGHLASGSFAFGVKVTPTPAANSAVRSPPASTWAVAARWCFYIGVMGLVGVALIGGLLWRPSPRLRWVAMLSFVLAAGGVIALEEQQGRADGIALSNLMSSSLGNEILWRAVPLVVAGAAAVWIMVHPRNRAALLPLGVAALVAMLGDVESSHVSGERSWRWFHLLTQWVHFASAGIWLGGLASLLVMVGTLDPESRRRVIRRFSNVALVSVFVLLTSGVLRGLDEIRSWHGLFDTSFGRWAMLKVSLLIVLIGLGLVQRTMSVPYAGRGSPRLLRQVGSSELALAAIVLVAAGFLQSLAPPSATNAPKPPKPLVVTGADFATTVQTRLEISPGTPGFNRFTLQALDYDTLRPVAAQAVTLTFALPSRPDLGSSTLNLSPQPNGEYEAVAPNLSVAGSWSVDALIQQASQSAEVPLTITTRSPPVRIDVSRSPGLPTVYTIHVTPSANMQVYLDPGRPGFNEFHVTVLDSKDNEIPTSQLTVHAGKGSQVAAPLTVRRLDSIGHYVADVPGASSGNYKFSIDAITNQGSLHADITIPVS
jgi:copper transport protein